MFKKILTLTIALAAMFMLFTLASCENSGKKSVKYKEDFVGEWNVSIDLGNAIKGSANDDPLSIDTDFTGITLDTTVKFNDDGTYTITHDDASLNAAVDKMVDMIVDDVYNNYEPDMLEGNFDMSKEEYRSLMKGTTDAATLSDKLGLCGSGKYSYKDGKIKLENGITVTYEADGNNIKFKFDKEAYFVEGTGTRAE